MEIGQNLVRLRGEKTQQEVAEAMRLAGYKWSQATVWAVEKGERPLRLTEAVDLAKIFDKEVSALVQRQAEATLIDGIEANMKSVGASMDAIGEAVRSYEREKRNLRQTLFMAGIAIKQKLVHEDFRLHLGVQQERADMIFGISAEKLARIAAEESDVKHPEEA